jgi:hypothetical protein
MSSFLNLLSLTPALTGCETGGFSKNEYEVEKSPDQLMHSKPTNYSKNNRDNNQNKELNPRHTNQITQHTKK